MYAFICIYLFVWVLITYNCQTGYNYFFFFWFLLHLGPGCFLTRQLVSPLLGSTTFVSDVGQKIKAAVMTHKTVCQYIIPPPCQLCFTAAW